MQWHVRVPFPQSTHRFAQHRRFVLRELLGVVDERQHVAGISSGRKDVGVQGSDPDAAQGGLLHRELERTGTAGRTVHTDQDVALPVDLSSCDHDRTWRVCRHLYRHRTDQQAGEATQAATAEHDHHRVAGLVEKCRCRGAGNHLTADRDVGVGRLYAGQRVVYDPLRLVGQAAFQRSSRRRSERDMQVRPGKSVDDPQWPGAFCGQSSSERHRSK